MSVLISVEVDGERLAELELELFFLLLSVTGNETTRNLIAGAMLAFFDHPDQWQRLRRRPIAAVDGHRRDAALRHARHELPPPDDGPGRARGQRIEEDQKVVFFHISANRDEDIFENPDKFDIGRSPNPHMAFGGGGPHFCLGTNLARMEIRVMFQHLLDRMPDLRLDGEPQRLQSAFINGVKHLPIAFSPGATVGR